MAAFSMAVPATPASRPGNSWKRTWQLSRTDRDARRLTKHGKTVMGYNVQTVIDAKFKLILAHEVTNAGNDFGQLVPMIKKAKDVLANGIAQAISKQPTAAPTGPLVALADAGYFTETDIAACAANQTTVYVPIPDKHRAVVKQGRLSGQDFHYDPDQDIYTCPGEQSLTPRGKPALHRGVLRQRYKSYAATCKACSIRSQCLAEKSSVRTIHRSEHADAVERHRQHMANSSDKMRQRAELCEHPFGTMKRWLGWDHFLVRGFKKVRGEMALLVNCYNLKRALNIRGLEAFIAACEARRLHQDVEGGRGALSSFFLALFSRLLRLLRPFFGVAGLFPLPKSARPAARLGHATVY
jgi:transcription elongation factor Elf1